MEEDYDVVDLNVLKKEENLAQIDFKEEDRQDDNNFQFTMYAEDVKEYKASAILEDSLSMELLDEDSNGEEDVEDNGKEEAGGEQNEKEEITFTGLSQDDLTQHGLSQSDFDAFFGMEDFQISP